VCLCLLVSRLPSTSLLFPYTTLFRSCNLHLEGVCPTGALVYRPDPSTSPREESRSALQPDHLARPRFSCLRRQFRDSVRGQARRSEEHTSELQSPYDLVCRLLLEKKN